MRLHTLCLSFALLLGCHTEPQPPAPRQLCEEQEGRTVCQCVPHWAGYDCDHCAPGWTGDACETDIDECASEQGGCSEYATCTNVPGTRTCTCNPGYTGDGRICVVWIHSTTEGSGQGHTVVLGADGHVFVAGHDSKAYPYSFLRRFDAAGNLEWSRDIGPETYDFVFDAAGNLYIAAGHYFRKYDAAGNLLWNRLLMRDVSVPITVTSVATDGQGLLYVAGSINGGFSSGEEIYLARISEAGEILWERQLGTAGADRATSVRIDVDGSAYVAGVTGQALEGQVSSGLQDVFVAKYGADGTRVWLRQFGTPANEGGGALAVGADGSAYVTGYTQGRFDPSALGGTRDIFVARLDVTGTLQWILQAGASGEDEGMDVAVSPEGRLFVTGSTTGRLDPSATEGMVTLGQAFLLEATPQGTLQRVRQLSLAEGSIGRSLRLTPDGHVILTGSIVHQSSSGLWQDSLLLMKF